MKGQQNREHPTAHAEPFLTNFVPLQAEFFARSPLVVARELIGCYLCRSWNKKEAKDGLQLRNNLPISKDNAKMALFSGQLEQAQVGLVSELSAFLGGIKAQERLSQNRQAYQIIETEAYEGPEDLASHARFGKTARNALMFGPSGYWYVYLCYGIHCMLNIVTEVEGRASAVLIRGVQSASGPGRLTQQLSITRQFNGQRCEPNSGLWIVQNSTSIPLKTQTTPRIGVAYAGPIWAQKPYRFVAKSY